MTHKLFQGVGFFLVTLLLSLMLAACGDSPTATPAPTTAAPTTASATTLAPTSAPATTAAPTTAAVATTAAPSTAAATTRAATAAPATTVAAATTAAVATTAAPATGPGSELIGQLIAVGDSDVRVKNVQRLEEIKGTTKTAAPKGIFMVIFFDVANLGKKPQTLSFLNLLDDKERKFISTADSDALGALFSLPQYRSSILVNPGFVGTEVKLYDVPKDAAGFKIEADKTFYKDAGRKASAESFTISGGKGPDSAAGPELVGKKFTNKDKVTATITQVERLSEVKSSSKTITAEGVYLIIAYEVKNEGDKPTSLITFYPKDSEGRTYSPSANFDVIAALASKYKTDLNINPGQSGQGFKTFEVLKEAKGFELVENF